MGKKRVQNKERPRVQGVCCIGVGQWGTKGGEQRRNENKGSGLASNKSDGVQTSDAFCRSARVLVSELCCIFMFFMQFCSILALSYLKI